MAVKDADPQKLKQLADRAKDALASGNENQAAQVVKDLAAQVGTDGLKEIWKSGS